MPEFIVNVGDFPEWGDLDDFTRGYLEAMFFTSSLGENGDIQVNDAYSLADIAPEALARIKADCGLFLKLAREALQSAFRPSASHPEVTALWRGGTDFWYTRNGHGVGFWETDRWQADIGELLTRGAKAFGESDLYVGDDGKLYV